MEKNYRWWAEFGKNNIENVPKWKFYFLRHSPTHSISLFLCVCDSKSLIAKVERKAFAHGLKYIGGEGKGARKMNNFTILPWVYIRSEGYDEIG